MINQEVDPDYIQMLENNATKSTPCPLMKRTGNCLCKAQCPYDHTPAFKKNIEEIKQFVPSKTGKFSLAAAQHSENINASGQAEDFTNSNEHAQQQEHSSYQSYEMSQNAGFQGNQYAGFNQGYQNFAHQQPTFSHQDVYEDDTGDLEDEGEEWFPDYRSCHCCKGFVNNCKGETCVTLGQCFCIIKNVSEGTGAGNAQ